MSEVATRRWKGPELRADGRYHIMITRDEVRQLSRDLPMRFEGPGEEMGADERLSAATAQLDALAARIADQVTDGCGLAIGHVADFRTSIDPRATASRPEPKNDRRASNGECTIGSSARLNDVFSTISGCPRSARRSSRQR